MMFRAVVGLVLSLLSACQPTPHDIKETRFLLGTLVEFTVFSDDEDAALDAIRQAAQAMQKVEDTFTTFGDVNNSVKAFNQTKVGQVAKLDSAVEQLLLLSLDIHQQSHGAFDPTLGALNELWTFSGDNLAHSPPEAAKIKRTLQQTGVKKVTQSTAGWLKKVDGLKLDFGGIAKGLAIDGGASVLKKLGFNQAIINAGGDMMVLGKHGDKPWRIAIRHPRLNKPLGWVAIDKDTSIVTSGDYERFYIYNGKRYHHILDPETGYPSAQSQSVTVIASDATTADAWSTALFVLGMPRGKEMVQKMKGMQAFVIGEQGKIWESSGFKLQQ